MNYKEYLKSAYFLNKRKETLNYWDNSCSLCCSNIKLNVHHRRYNLFQENQNDLIVLCEDCHNKFHNILPIAPKEVIKPKPPLTQSEQIEISTDHSWQSYLLAKNDWVSYLKKYRFISADMPNYQEKIVKDLEKHYKLNKFEKIVYANQSKLKKLNQPYDIEEVKRLVGIDKNIKLRIIKIKNAV